MNGKFLEIVIKDEKIKAVKYFTEKLLSSGCCSIMH